MTKSIEKIASAITQDMKRQLNGVPCHAPDSWSTVGDMQTLDNTELAKATLTSLAEELDEEALTHAEWALDLDSGVSRERLETAIKAYLNHIKG